MVIDNANEAMKPSEYRKKRRSAQKTGNGKIIGNIACPKCRSTGGDSSGNHLILFDTGGGHCNRCPKTYSAQEITSIKDGNNVGNNTPRRGYSGDFKSNYIPRKKGLELEDMVHLGYVGDTKRGIFASTDQHFGIRTEINTGNRKPIARYYPYYSGDDLYGYKNRKLPKEWGIDVGSIKATDLFGWHLCIGMRKTLVITEGEEDAAIGYQMWKSMNMRSNNRRVKRSVPHIVSLPNGAKGAKKALMRHLSDLHKYERIIWMGDNVKIDEEGAKALDQAVEVLGVKKLYVPEYPENIKDLCDLYDPQDIDGSVDAFSDMWWTQDNYRPVDIKDGSSYTWDNVFQEPVIGYELPFKSISDKIGGLRLREHTVMMAGSGCGKTTFCRKIGHYMGVQHGWKIGSIFLEEQDTKTVQGYLSCHLDVALNILRKNPERVNEEDRITAMAMIEKHHMFLKHSGSIDPDVLMNKLRYMYNMGCKLIIFDHLTMAVNGEEDQRTALDNLMEDIYSFCENHDVHVLSVIHLSRDNKSLFSRGAEITENNLRGSAGVLQQCWNAIAIEGDIQHPEFANHRFIRILKCREIGDLGICSGGYIYDPKTGGFSYDESLYKEMIFEGQSANNEPKFGSSGKSKKGGTGDYNNKAS